MCKLISLVISVSLCYTLSAQTSNTLIGARAASVGNTSACLHDVWSLFNNSGGLAKVDKTTVGFTYEARPQFSAFNRLAAVIAAPTKLGVVGLGVFRFGDDLYNEQVASAAFSNELGLASLGIKINYIQYNALGFGRRGLLSISFGGIAELTPALSVGAHIVNVNQPEITEEGEQLPTLMVAGAWYKASEVLSLMAEVEKDLMYEPTVKGGIEYQPFKKIIFRSGFNIKPQAAFFGIGFKPAKFNLDYAYSYYPDSGARHQASIGYKVFNNRK